VAQRLHRKLADEHPGAAGSLEEGVDETLTVTRLGLPEWLERTLSTAKRSIERWMDGGRRDRCLRPLSQDPRRASSTWTRARSNNALDARLQLSRPTAGECARAQGTASKHSTSTSTIARTAGERWRALGYTDARGSLRGKPP
jgi:hypothetical protein